MTQLGPDAEVLYCTPGTAERCFEQLLYPGQQLTLTPSERRRSIRVIVLDYVLGNEAEALGAATDSTSGLMVQGMTLRPGSTFTVPAQGGIRMQHHQPEQGQGLVLPVLLVSTADERELSRVQ